MDGFLLINKPQGPTSHDVCRKLKKIADEKRVGHTGTLDPMAEGLLVILLGKSTKLAEYIVSDSKEYTAEISFGIRTDTQDVWGTVLSETAPDFSREDLTEVLNSFVGQTEQFPPMYSALKHKGRHLYDYARKGESVERKSRSVTIHRLILTESGNLPRKAEIKVLCSKGTYIRTLCYDIGEKLGCGAVMSALTRTKIGAFSLADAHTPDEIASFAEQGSLQDLVSAPDALIHTMGRADVKTESARIVLNGNLLEQRNLLPSDSDLREGERLRIYLSGNFVAVGHVCPNGTIQPEKVFHP